LAIIIIEPATALLARGNIAQGLEVVAGSAMRAAGKWGIGPALASFQYIAISAP
jgi:hypothetical protein